MASAMANIEPLKGLYDQLKTRMDKTVEDFRANLLSVRTGRASVHMLDQVKVDYYGTDTPVAQVAQRHRTNAGNVHILLRLRCIGIRVRIASGAELLPLESPELF